MLRTNAEKRVTERKFEMTALADYFWENTVLSVMEDRESPRLEFWINGSLAFLLQTETFEEGEDSSPSFVVIDYDDHEPFETSNPVSKRGLTVILEDEESRCNNRVFARILEGSRDQVDVAIAWVVEQFCERDQWPSVDHALDCVVTKPILTLFDGYRHDVDRRYRDVDQTKGQTPACNYHKSERAEKLELAGDAVLTAVRILVAHKCRSFT